MLFFVNKAGHETKRLLIMSTAIIGTGMLAYTPNILLFVFQVYWVGQESDNKMILDHILTLKLVNNKIATVA